MSGAGRVLPCHVLRTALGRASGLALVAVAVPALAFVGSPYWQTVEPLPLQIDRPLYCAEVMMNAAGARAAEGVRQFQMRLAASHLLGTHGDQLLEEAGWTPEDSAHRYTSGMIPEVEADRQAGTLRYSEAECLALARSFTPLDAPAEVNLLVACSELLHIRAEELSAAGDEAASGEMRAGSIALGARALNRLEAAGLTFSGALDIVEHNGLLQRIALGEGEGPVADEQCRSLLHNASRVPD